MGGASSKSSNVANIINNTNVNVDSQCSAKNLLNVDSTLLTLGNIKCDGPIDIGNVTSIQTSSCNLDTSIAAVSKASADQTAKSSATASGGLIGPSFSFASSESDNTLDLQNNIEVMIRSSCGAEQNTNVGKRVYKVGDITGKGACSIGNVMTSQNAMCVNNVASTTSMDSTATQAATSTAKSGGFNLAGILGLIIIVGLVRVLMSSKSGGLLGGLMSPDGCIVRYRSAATQLAALKSQDLKKLSQEAMNAVAQASQASAPAVTNVITRLG
jgi:hypothetical protein